MSMRLSHRGGPRCRRLLLACGVASALALSACSSSAGSSGTKNSSAANTLGTLKPGVIKVAIEPYAPYTSMQGSSMVGLDADVLNAAAAKLGLKVEPVVTDFAGML